QLEPNATIPARPWISRSKSEPERKPAPAPAPSELEFAMPDLTGIRAIELTWAWAGPFVGRFLGAFGADVVHVEAGRWPDGWRGRPKWKNAGVTIPDGVDPDALTDDAFPCVHRGN